MAFSDLDASNGRTASSSRPARPRFARERESSDADIDDAEIEELPDVGAPTVGAPRLSPNPPSPALNGLRNARTTGNLSQYSADIDGPTREPATASSPLARLDSDRVPAQAATVTPPRPAGPLARPVPPRPVPVRRPDTDLMARMPIVGRLVVRQRQGRIPEPGAPNPWWRRVAKAGVAVVFICSFALSFAALHSLALGAGIDHSLAWMFPVCIDTLAIVASATAVAVQNGGRKMTWSPWAVVLIFLAVSIAGNAQHAYSTNDITVSTHIAVAVSAVPPIALGLALHLLLLMARQRTGRFAAPQKVESRTENDGQ